MKKRALATVLWFYTGWVFGALISWVLGLALPLGPVVATAAGAVVAIDPRHVIWEQRQKA
jgi:hypothetical protein